MSHVDSRLASHKAKPPASDGLPVIGTTHQFVSDHEGRFEAVAEQGDAVRRRLLGTGPYSDWDPTFGELVGTPSVLAGDPA